MKLKAFFITVIIIFFGVVLRTYGVNWDQGHHLHPDERFLTMVSNAMKIPKSFHEYLNPQTSTLNPPNVGFGFFVYGTLSIVINKLIVIVLDMDTYHQTTIAGRYMSAFIDAAVIFFIIKLVELFEKKYKFSDKIKYLAGFSYAISVLPIQNSHFFTVDAAAHFFTFSSIFFIFKYLYEKKKLWVILSAVFFGCAIGSKISSVYIAPLLGLVFLKTLFPLKREHFKNFLLAGIFFVLGAYITIRFADPYLFESSHFLNLQPNKVFMQNIQQLKGFSNPDGWFPPAFQWIGKKPILFPLQNIIFFGVGLPMFFSAVCGAIFIIRKKYGDILIILFWTLLFFLYQGVQFATSMRYFYNVYPVIAICSGYGLYQLCQYFKRDYRETALTVGLFLWLIWPMSFMMIYTRPHSRVTASEWIYQNIPKNSVITFEYWDDPLPLLIDYRYMDRYKVLQLPVFEYDTPDKWTRMNQMLSEAEYIIMSSNRAYGSIVPIANKFPQTAEYYRKLFAGTGDFVKIADITSFPEINLGFMTIPINDQWSEEAFTVYDHPRVTIFKRK